MSGYDPGGDPPNFTALQENFQQQQAKITALKELVRQSETAQGQKNASAQEKVKNIAQRLTQFKAKASKSRLNRTGSEVSSEMLTTSICEEGPDTSYSSVNMSMDLDTQPHSLPIISRPRSETPGLEKVQLLRQQMEWNRMKMAERESHKRDIEERVNQLKSSFEGTKRSVENIGRSTGDLNFVAPSPIRERCDFNRSTSDLSKIEGHLQTYIPTTNIDFERMKYLEGRVKFLEDEIANKENSNISVETIKMLEHKILDLEENLREKECIIDARTQAVSLMSENLSLKGKTTVDLLEDTRQEMYKMQTNFVHAESSLNEDVQRLQIGLEEKDNKISNLEEMNNILETARFDLTVENADLKKKLEEVQEYSNKIRELNKVIQTLNHRINDLESQKYEMFTDEEVEQARMSETELKDRIKELEEEIERRSSSQHSDDETLKETIDAQCTEIESLKDKMSELQENLQEKCIELNVLNANFSVLQEKLKSQKPKPLFPKTPEEELDDETTKLKQQLDEANKNMIKAKLKIKQLQKQVDSFKKSSNVHEEVVRLTEENQRITQKLTELEEEKGNLQLHLVNYDGSLPGSELEKRIKVLEATLQNQNQAIILLEEQKLDICEDLNTTKHELETIKDQSKDVDTQDPSQITTQMSSIELEEKLEKCCTDRQQLVEQMHLLEEENRNLKENLEKYVVENMELLDKIDKLSLEKVSSAESIEIVDNLSQQEKLEIEDYEKLVKKQQDDEGENDENLNESLVKLREESSELLHKIELFTNERREVLDKLEALTVENHHHLEEIEALKSENENLKGLNDSIEMEKHELIDRLESYQNEKSKLLIDLEETNNLKVKLQEQLTQSPVSSVSASPAKSTIDKDSFEKLVKALETEVQNYHKTKDQKQKTKITKKLITEAKNLQTSASQLMSEFHQTLESSKQLQAEIDGLKEKLLNLDSCEEVKKVKMDLLEVQSSQIEKIEQIDLLKQELVSRNEEIMQIKADMEEQVSMLEEDVETKNGELSEVRSKLERIEKEYAHENMEVQYKLDAANKEITILKDLVAEQKQQLIESYQEQEDDINSKLKTIQNYENEMEKMKRQIENMESLKKDLENKQETIQMLNKQIIELYKTMEENSNKIIEKDDEIQYLQEVLDAKKDEINVLHDKAAVNMMEIDRLQKLLDDDASKMVLEARIKQLESLNSDLEAKNKEQVEKLKRFAANFKKKNVQCAELEEKLAKSSVDNEIKQKLVDYEEQINLMKRENSKLNENVQQSSSFESELFVLKAENEEMSQKLFHLNHELHRLLQIKCTLETEKEEFEKIHKENNEQIEGLLKKCSNVEKLQEEIESLRTLNKSLSEKCDKISTITEELTAKNLKLEKCKAIIKEKNSKLHDFDKKLQGYEAFKDEKDQLNENLKELNEKYSSSLNDQANLQEKLDNLVATNIENLKEKEQILEKLNILTIETEEKRVTIDDIEREFSTLNTKYCEILAQNETLKHSVQDFENKMLNFIKIEDEKKILESECAEINAKNDKLTSELQEIMTEKDILKNQHENIRMHNESLLATVNSKSNEASNDKKHLESRVNDLMAELLKSGEEFQRIEQYVKISDDEKQRYYTQLNDLGAKYNDVLQEKEAHLVEIHKMKDENQKLAINLELNEQEIQKLIARIVKLEEGIEYVEERRRSLERQKQVMSTEWQEKQHVLAESEDYLLRKLEHLTQHDERIEKKLEEKEEEINSLTSKLREFELIKTEMGEKINALTHELQEKEKKLQKTNEIQEENADLRKDVTNLQNELKKVQSDFEKRMKVKEAEIDEMENELSNQLNKVENERKALQENLEKSNDRNVDLQDEIGRLRDSLSHDGMELQELRMQIVVDQTEIENLRAQYENLLQNHQSDMNALRQQIADMEAINTQVDQNQTDDQAMLQQEAIKLKELLAEKEAEILQYQQRNLQLQMTTMSMVAEDPFSSFSGRSDDAKHEHLEEKIRDMENDLTLKDARIQELIIEKNLLDDQVRELRRPPVQEEIVAAVSVANVMAVKGEMDFKKLQNEIDCLKAQNVELLDLKAQIEALKAQNDFKESTINSFKDEIEVMSKKHQDLVSNVEHKSKKIEELLRLLNESQEKCMQLESVKAEPSISSFFGSGAADKGAAFEDIIVSQKSYECFDHEEKIKQLEREISLLTEKNVKLEENVKKLHNKNLKADNVKLSQLKSQIDTFKVENVQLPDLKAQIEALNVQNNQKESTINVLKDEIEVISKQYQTLMTEIEHKSKKIDELLHLLNESQEKCLKLETIKVKPSVSSFFGGVVTDKSAAFEDIIVPQKSYECFEHEEKIIQLEKGINLLMDKNAKLEENVKILQDEIDILNAKNCGLSEEIQNKSKSFDELIKTLNDYQNKICELEESANKKDVIDAPSTASFFGGQTVDQSTGIFEEIIVPKKTYQCHPPVGGIDMDEDVWGGEEALLEEKHQQSNLMAVQVTSKDAKLKEKDEIIQQLEMEKSRLQQDITDLKVKSGKLLKKVKEYKSKADNLEAKSQRSASVESNELDLAIQEELNSQVKMLESKLKEGLLEKDSLLKRVDVLTAANERMLEMKERQDGQMEVNLAKIRELHGELNQLKEWGDESYQQKEPKLATEAIDKKILDELNKEIADLQVDNDELQALLEEEKSNSKRLDAKLTHKQQEVTELIQKIDELSNDSNDIKTSLEQLYHEKAQENLELSKKLKEFMDKNSQLSVQIETMRSDSIFQNPQFEMAVEEKIQQLNASLQYKESEILHLNDRIKELIKEDQTESLVQEILHKNQEISNLRTKVQALQSDKNELENNLSLQITTEEKSAMKAKYDKLEKINQELLDEKQNMEEELQVLNDQVLKSLEFEDKMNGMLLELDAKNIEIQVLKSSLNEVNSGESTTNQIIELKTQLEKLSKEKADLDANYRAAVDQLNGQWSQHVEQRTTEIAESWKKHLHMRETEFTVIEQSLRDEIDQIRSHAGHDHLQDEDQVNDEIDRLQRVLESQEVEIVTLKEQLAIRSAEYARLAAQVDPYAVRHASNMVTGQSVEQTEERVPKSELELALYMVYQRDMRCEELELELRNLLEERDSLQLRLSDALRQAELFKRKIGPGGPSSESTEDSKTPTPEKSLQQIVQESGISATSDAAVLTTKLSELHAISQAKEKHDDKHREDRSRQLDQMQMDLAQLPMEAAAKITGRNIPQSETSQSASSVLLNWILGRNSDN